MGDMRAVVLLLVLIGFLGSLSAESRLLALPGAIPATLEGEVRDGSGQGVPSVRVELWSGNRLLASTRTEGSGAFRLESEEAWTPDWRLALDRLGYAPISIPVPGDLAPLEIILEASPLPLPGFEVEGDRDFCAAGESAEARGLWEAARLRHAGGLDTLGVASYMHLRTDTLSNGAGNATGLLGAIAGQRASAPLLRLSWNRRIDREGYAFRVRRSDLARSYDSWSYPPLEADFAPHFGEASFGRLHRFHIETEAADGWILRFCGTRTNEPHLLGILEIGPDTLIRRAEWRFHTPEPDEEAGGWARFPPAMDPAGSPPLLPTESMSWRRLPDGEVIRRVQWYEGWILAPGDSVPFLPIREGDQGS